jgi:esterase/lipase
VVIIAHQSDETRCDVVPIAAWLRDNHFAAVVVDLAGDWTGVLTAVIEDLRARGHESIQLLGASKGGADAMVVASQVAPPVNAVLSLGGERRVRPDLDSDAAVGRSHVPLLIITSENDGFLNADEAQQLINESASSDKKLLVLPGSLHGFAMLDGPDAQQVRQTILEFLAAHTGPEALTQRDFYVSSDVV